MQEPAQLRIGELARRVGMSPVLIRAWESRYAVLAPERSSGGFRLYSERDEVRLRRIQEHVAEGLSTAQAAARGLAEVPLRPPTRIASRSAAPIEDLAGVAEQLLVLLERFDETAAQALLDRVLAGASLDAAIREVVLPALGELGRRWQFGEVTVGQEHFASSVIQGRLLAMARGWDRGGGPVALLACPAGEQHAIGLICFGLALSARGWRIVYLGASTPTSTTRATADALGVGVVVISATHPQAFVGEQEAIRELAGRHRVALGGAGATTAVAGRIGVSILAGDPVTAADQLAQEER